MPEISIVYSTVGSRTEAVVIGRALVEERLAACANVLDGVTSVYRWEGVVQEDSEAILLLKTRSELVKSVMSRIRALHGYDCPAIVSWELAQVSADYRQWVCEQTSSMDTSD